MQVSATLSSQSLWQMKLFVLILAAERRSWQIRRYESVAMSLRSPSISFSHSLAQHKYLCNCILENVLWEIWGNSSMDSEEMSNKIHHLVCIRTLSVAFLVQWTSKLVKDYPDRDEFYTHLTNTPECKLARYFVLIVSIVRCYLEIVPTITKLQFL